MLRITRRRTLGLLGGLAAATAGAAVGFPYITRARHPKEAILLIIADAMRADKVGKVVNGMEVTPRLNALAAESACFTQAHSSAPWTKTSVASILSGRYAPYHAVEHHCFTLPDVPTIPSYLKTRGYYTAAVQTNAWLEPELRKSQNDPASPCGFDKPFDLYRYKKHAGTPDKKNMGMAYARADTVNASFRRLVEKRFRRLGIAAPLFAYLHYMDTHQPWLATSPTLFTGRFHAPAVARATPAEVLRNDWQVMNKVLFDHQTPNAEETAVIEAVNDEAAAYLDAKVGKILDFLKNRGIYDQTSIIFTSDHGTELYEHGVLGHGRNLYNPALRVPLIIKRPGLQPLAIDKRVPNTAIFATIADWFNDPQNDNSPLVPLQQYIANPALPHFPIYANFKGSGKIILPDSTAAIEDHATGKTLFFNIENDPAELHPLPADQEASKQLARLDAFSRNSAKSDNVSPALTTHPWQFAKDIDELRKKGVIEVTNVEALSDDRKQQLKALGYLN